MRILSASEVEGALDFSSLVERLREAFRRGADVPLRHHHTVPVTGEPDATLLLMPAWQTDRSIGIKSVTIFPGNGEKGLPAVMGVYLLLDAKNGSPKALIDGPMLTLRRTAAASALASSYLSRWDASRLLMVGTGALAPHLILAHCTVRQIKQVLIWGRNPDKAAKLAGRVSRALKGQGITVGPCDDLAAAAPEANVISCATLSKDPLIKGDWLQPGAHVDLVGGFTPEMREADDAAIGKARVFVDTFEGACTEAGDIVQPMQSGLLPKEDIAADLYELTRGDKAGRRYYDQITLFKSVGTALEDLAAAQLAVERI